jgi:glycerol-3-phosphate responsive antiterminator
MTVSPLQQEPLKTDFSVVFLILFNTSLLTEIVNSQGVQVQKNHSLHADLMEGKNER